VLCGNRRILDPVCGELLRRGVRVWWLYDRFALRCWLRWRLAGAGELFCDSSLGRGNRLAVDVPPRLKCRGVDLGPLVRRWLTRRLEAHGPRYTRLIEQIDAHFGSIRPAAVVVDEDATPMARAAVALARQHGASSWVVQHGAPCGRFGFAPLAADRILVWGRSSAWQLTRWGVHPQQIRAAGSPWHDRLYRVLAPARAQAAAPSRAGARRSGGPQVLLLTTVPPRDGRPDLVAHRLTRHTYAEMVRIAFAAVAKLRGARLIVRLHPRTPDDPVVESMVARFRSVRGRVVRRGSLEDWLGGNDCVLSCLSSTAVDATLAGVPVIQLLPQGSGDVLPAAEWGLAGTARTEAELDRLLARVLHGSGRTSDLDLREYRRTDFQSVLSKERTDCKSVLPAASHWTVHGHEPPGAWADVFGDFARPAAAGIADAVLGADVQTSVGFRSGKQREFRGAKGDGGPHFRPSVPSGGHATPAEHASAVSNRQ